MSYNVEQSRGEDLHNAVYLLMHSKELSVQEAIDIVGDLVESDANRFVTIMNSLPWNDDNPCSSLLRPQFIPLYFKAPFVKSCDPIS